MKCPKCGEVFDPAATPQLGEADVPAVAEKFYKDSYGGQPPRPYAEAPADERAVCERVARQAIGLEPKAA